ncbi:hypothetical protein J3R83DRAFT_3362 [Lanmaoa asiatica]|nr:hypothetical protein J3R83DRAFT_3362 [Lanmaoa asiatica]
MVNALQMDSAYINDLASLPESMLSSSNVAYLPKLTECKKLVGQIQGNLAEGRTVVLKGYGSVDSFEFSLKGLLEEFNCLLGCIIQVHNMWKHAKDPTNPYIKITVKPSTYFNGVQPDPHLINVKGSDLPPNTFLVGSWGLLHQVAIITSLHHNAEGTCTWVILYNGCKVWTCIKVRTLFDHKKLAGFLAKLTNRKNIMSGFEDDIKCETVYLYPGDLA